jgi:hypothetical protein
MGKNIKGGKKHKKQKNNAKSGFEKNSSTIARPNGEGQYIGQIKSALGSKRFLIVIKGKEYNCRLRGSRKLKGMSAYAKSGCYCLCSHRGYENVYDILNVYHVWEVIELKKEGLIPKVEGTVDETIIFENTGSDNEEGEKEKNIIPQQKRPINDDYDISSDDDEEYMREAILIQQRKIRE